MKFILLVIFAFQLAKFGQAQNPSQTYITPPLPYYCSCLREWKEDREAFFGTHDPQELAKNIFNSWNTIVEDNCIDTHEYKKNSAPRGTIAPNYCTTNPDKPHHGSYQKPNLREGYGGYVLSYFIRDGATNKNCDKFNAAYPWRSLIDLERTCFHLNIGH